jgi:glycosyltransferase involved in cell wall biosynthesis
MAAPRFSVVTPSFNQGRFLRENLASVITQDYPYVEHIVIDNASTDGSIEILREHPSVNWVSEPDHGQSDAVNKGIARGTYEWIIWLNSDDYLLPGALSRLARFIESNADIEFIYSNVFHVSETGAQQLRRRPNYSRWKLTHWWWCSLQLWQPGTAMRRSLFDAAGPLDVSLHYAMDFDLFLKAQGHCAFHYLDAELVAFRLHDRQKGHENEGAFTDERIKSTLAYWRETNRAAYYLYAAILYFVRGSLMFVEGLRYYERGDNERGKTLVRRGLCRNPLAWMRIEHFGFWLRRTIGSERYYRFRR